MRPRETGAVADPCLPLRVAICRRNSHRSDQRRLEIPHGAHTFCPGSPDRDRRKHRHPTGRCGIPLMASHAVDNQPPIAFRVRDSRKSKRASYDCDRLRGAALCVCQLCAQATDFYNRLLQSGGAVTSVVVIHSCHRLRMRPVPSLARPLLPLRKVLRCQQPQRLSRR